MRARLIWVIAATILLSGFGAPAENVPPPVTIDLKAAGMAADLFSKPPENRDQARGMLNIFWLTPDQLVAAFSTTPRYPKPKEAPPLGIRMVVFDSAGKQLATKDWSFAATGPEGDASLDIEPGPDHTILVIHVSATDTGVVPEGNQLQVLSGTGKLLQNFYIPSDSALLPPPSAAASSLVLQRYTSEDRSTLRFFTGRPLKSRLEFQVAKKSETITGPMEVARLICSKPAVCPKLHVARADGTGWDFTDAPENTPHPRAFLGADTILVEVEVPNKPSKLMLVRPNSPPTLLPQIKNNDAITNVAGVATDGSRFALDTYGGGSMCNFLDFACSYHAKSLVFDISGVKKGEAAGGSILFEKGLSVEAGKSALSPDGRRLAVLDHGKLLVFSLP